MASFLVIFFQWKCNYKIIHSYIVAFKFTRCLMTAFNERSGPQQIECA